MERQCETNPVDIQYFPLNPIETIMQRSVIRMEIREKKDHIQLYIHTADGLYETLDLCKYPLTKRHKHKKKEDARLPDACRNCGAQSSKVKIEDENGEGTICSKCGRREPKD